MPAHAHPRFALVQPVPEPAFLASRSGLRPSPLLPDDPGDNRLMLASAVALRRRQVRILGLVAATLAVVCILLAAALIVAHGPLS